MLVAPPPKAEMPEFVPEVAAGNSGNVVFRCLPGAGGTGGKSTDLLVPIIN